MQIYIVSKKVNDSFMSNSEFTENYNNVLKLPQSRILRKILDNGVNSESIQI